MLDAAFRDRAVYLRPTSTLVVADLHVGRAAASDVEFPIPEGRDLTDRLQALLDAFAPGEVVFAGDVLHAFDRVPAGASETLDALLSRVHDAGADPVLVAGNHDSMLSTLVDSGGHDAYRLDDGTVVHHGHVEPRTEGALYVVGHDHPAIDIQGRKQPCYLYGDGVYGGADVLVLPAFTRLAPGVVVNTMRANDFQSPLVRDADALRPLVHDREADDTLTFPPLGELRRLL